MNKFLRTLSLAAALCAMGSAAQAAPQAYDFKYVFGYDSSIVEGSFTGTANGNLITDLSNISVFWHGVAFAGNGNLFGSSNNNGWQSGSAVASFDGLQNNFLFIDSNYPVDTGYTNYFLSLPGTNGQREVDNAAGQYVYENYTLGTSGSSWAVTAVGAQVPEPSTVLLLALGLGAVAFASRRTK